MTQDDEAGEKILKRLSLLPEIASTDFSYFSADDIKQAGDKRESRLLAGQDTKSARPKIFRKN